MINKENLFKIVDEIKDEMINIRRHLHKHPELSFCERNTMDYICRILDENGVEYTSGVAGTGVVAVIKGDKYSAEPKTLLIRADIDALPVDEICKKEYASVNHGIMHACGHDCHTAILLSVCKVLNELKSEFSGYIKLVFQPGEETTGGAKPMIDEGILFNPDVNACIALHVDTDIPTGSIKVKSGHMYASPDDFIIDVIGKGGHGAEPEKCINPILISASIINKINKMMQNEMNDDEKAVVTVCSVHAGTASNIIPSTARIIGTARSFTNETRLFLERRIGEIACDICNSYNAKCEYEFIKLYPPMINDKNIANLFRKVAIQFSDEIECIDGGEPTMAGEDFSYFTQSVPGIMFKLGCRNEKKGAIYPLHHEMFDVDEECLQYGAILMLAFALNYLN